ncbi:hypothetical protein CYY_006341 [Polysphondylium violaceum]|uniref:Uncharacterized protein n=1 Tax=Polysphondylium violaceum TaxID=133409 RepID=A0A8J4URK1_9MYCE|nr:hypothetical protein CYY_006341 [Polysphondylium violaceum]
MSNTDIVYATLVFDKDKEAIKIESNPSDISDEYLKKEFQEDVSQGSIPDLLKSILSIQEKSNIILTDFVNQEKAKSVINNNNSSNDNKANKKRTSEKEIERLDERSNDKVIKIDSSSSDNMTL